MADFKESDLQSLGKWQASHLIDLLKAAQDERRHSPRHKSRGGLIRWVVILISLFIVWRVFSTLHNSDTNKESTGPTPSPVKAENAHPVAPPKRTQQPASQESKVFETPAVRTAPGTLETLEGLTLPTTITSLEEISLRDSTGKEVSQPAGTSIKVTTRSEHGTLSMEINGALFVGNESRISGKVRLAQ